MFIVIGTTGEYSDRKEWLVAAYWEQDKATEHAARAKRRTAEIVGRFDGRWEALDAKMDGDAEAANQWDKDWDSDYTGTDYVVAEVPLLEAVPE